MKTSAPLLLAAALLVGCSGSATRNESTNTLSGILFNPMSPGSWSATVSGTVLVETMSSLTVSGETELEMNPLGTSTITYQATRDGELVAELPVDYEDPSPPGLQPQHRRRLRGLCPRGRLHPGLRIQRLHVG